MNRSYWRTIILKKDYSLARKMWSFRRKSPEIYIPLYLVLDRESSRFGQFGFCEYVASDDKTPRGMANYHLLFLDGGQETVLDSESTPLEKLTVLRNLDDLNGLLQQSGFYHPSAEGIQRIMRSLGV